MKKIILVIILFPFLFILSSCYTVLLSPNKEKEYDNGDVYYNYYNYSDYDFYYYYPWWLERRNVIYDDNISAPKRTPDNGDLRRDNSSRNTKNDRDILKDLNPPTRKPGNNDSGNSDNNNGNDNNNQNDSSKKRTDSTSQSDDSRKNTNNDNSKNLRNDNSSRSTDKGRR